MATCFNPEELKIVSQAIMATWQQVGSDVYAACKEEGERITNESAIECCIDAERVQMYGGARRVEAQRLLQKAFDDHGWQVVMKQLKKTIRLA